MTQISVNLITTFKAYSLNGGELYINANGSLICFSSSQVSYEGWKKLSVSEIADKAHHFLPVLREARINGLLQGAFLLDLADRLKKDVSAVSQEKVDQLVKDLLTPTFPPMQVIDPHNSLDSAFEPTAHAAWAQPPEFSFL